MWGSFFDFVKYIMRIKLYTVVDITETKARRSDDAKKFNQQQNYNTVLQTIGLRTNLIPIYCTSHIGSVNKLGFGKNITGKQRYWEFCFEIEQEGSLTKSMLDSDFDLVPIITELDETSHNYDKIFRTSCKNDCNIVFDFTEV